LHNPCITRSGHLSDNGVYQALEKQTKQTTDVTNRDKLKQIWRRFRTRFTLSLTESSEKSYPTLRGACPSG